MMDVYRNDLLRIAIAVLWLLISESFLWSSEEITSDQVKVRYGTQNFDVKYSVPKGQMTQFANDENCGNDNHRTKKADVKRFFKHIHNLYTLPTTGTDQFGMPCAITVDGMNAYWGNFYGPYYVKEGDPDHKYNCYGHAFGYNVWVGDPEYIFKDDYSSTSKYLADNRIRVYIGALDVHAILVKEVYPDNAGYEYEGQIKNTTEKYRKARFTNARTVPFRALMSLGRFPYLPKGREMV